MTLTQHGHHIPLTSDEDEPPLSERRVARCGGVHLCKVCKADFQVVLDKRKEQQMTEESDRYVRKQSNPVQARKITEENIHEMAKWTGGAVEDSYLRLPSITGAVEEIPIGYYVVKDLNNGRFYGREAAEFESMYQQEERRHDAMRNPQGNWPHPSSSYGRSADE